MHYYQFNIGDYASHTSRLTPIEDIAYRRMLDLYYLNEQPLNGCSMEVSREIGMIDHIKSVEYVLAKFFTKNENVFMQKRIDLEIKKYKSNAKNKSKAGKASAKARQVKASSVVTGVEQVLNTTPTNVEQNINHKPLTINHKPLSNKDIVVVTPAFNFKNELLALGVDKDILNDWMKVRKNKNATNTESAFRLLVSQISKSGLTIDQGIRFANSENWGAFKLTWYQNKQGARNERSQGSTKKPSAYERARANNAEYRQEQPNEREMVMGTDGGYLGRAMDAGEGRATIEYVDNQSFVDY